MWNPIGSLLQYGHWLKWLFIRSWSHRRLNFARCHGENANYEPAGHGNKKNKYNKKTAHHTGQKTSSCCVQFVEILAIGCSSPYLHFHQTKHFGPFNWSSYFSQHRLQSDVVCIHCYTNCGDIASVTRDITIKSSALLRQTGWLKALLFHRPTVTEITLSASFPYILSTFNDQRTEIIVRDLSHMDKPGLSISGRGVK